MLEKSDDALGDGVEIDVVVRRTSAEAGHGGHDAAKRVNEAGTGGCLHVTDDNRVALHAERYSEQNDLQRVEKCMIDNSKLIPNSRVNFFLLFFLLPAAYTSPTKRESSLPNVPPVLVQHGTFIGAHTLEMVLSTGLTSKVQWILEN